MNCVIQLCLCLTETKLSSTLEEKRIFHKIIITIKFYTIFKLVNIKKVNNVVNFNQASSKSS